MTLCSLDYLHVSLTSSYVPKTAMLSIDVYATILYQKLDSENTQATSFQCRHACRTQLSQTLAITTVILLFKVHTKSTRTLNIVLTPPFLGMQQLLHLGTVANYNMISLVVHNMSRSACICLFCIVMIKLTMLSGLCFAFYHCCSSKASDQRKRLLS